MTQGKIERWHQPLKRVEFAVEGDEARRTGISRERYTAAGRVPANKISGSTGSTVIDQIVGKSPIGADALPPRPAIVAH
jgi:hypothetical protein